MTDFPQIVVGTYEEFVLGYSPQTDPDKCNKYKLHQTFATHSHQASLRCVAARGSLMASSGADEYINIYNMSAMRVSRVLDYHNATVTCLEFTPDNSHLVTANQKGDIAIFRCRDWTLVKLWKEAHKHAIGVTSISIHPSSTLLMSTGADNILRFWNLVKGRQAYAKNFSKLSVGTTLNLALWSPTGNYYIVCIGKQLEVYKTSKAALVYKFVANSKISCATFAKKTLVCTGTEEGSLEIHSILEDRVVFQEKVHDSRLKCMSSFSKSSLKREANKIENYLVTADSKGVIKLWCLKKKGSNVRLLLKCSVDCDCRITCLTPVFPKSVKQEDSANISQAQGVEANEDNDVVVEGSLENGVTSKKKLKKKQKKKRDKSAAQCNGSARPSSESERVNRGDSSGEEECEKEISSKLQQKKRRQSESDGLSKREKMDASRLESGQKKKKKAKLSLSG